MSGATSFQFLHDRRHVGRGLIVTLVIDELDAFSLSSERRCRRRPDFPNARFSHNKAIFQRVDRLVQPLGEVVDDEIDCGLSVFARRRADLERPMPEARGAR